MYCPYSQLFCTPNLVRHQGKQRADYQYTTVRRSNGKSKVTHRFSRPSLRTHNIVAFKEFGRHCCLPGFDALYFPELQQFGIDFANNFFKSWQSPSFDNCHVSVVNHVVPWRFLGRWWSIHWRLAAFAVRQEVVQIRVKLCQKASDLVSRYYQNSEPKKYMINAGGVPGTSVERQSEKSTRSEEETLGESTECPKKIVDARRLCWTP